MPHIIFLFDVLLYNSEIINCLLYMIFRWKVTEEGNIVRQPGLKFVKGIHIRIWGKETDGETDAIA